jgi:tetratricopeptide (TPR) repeat protein
MVGSPRHCEVAPCDTPEAIHSDSSKSDAYTTDYKYEEVLKKEIKTVSEMSEDELKQKIYENPHNEEIILKLIQFYHNNQQWEQLDVYADMLPHNLKAVYYGIKSLENQNFVEEAYQKLAKVNFDNIFEKELLVNYLLLNAKLLIKLQKIDFVPELLNRAIKLDNTNPEGILTRGVFYLTQNMAGKALTDFEAILTVNPQNLKALQGKALALQTENRHQESSVCYLKILDLDSENLEAIHGLLKNSWATKDFVEIERVLDGYLEFHPANLEILFTLAGICIETQKFEKAKELLERILLFNEEYPGAMDMLKKVRKMAREAEMERAKREEEEGEG